MCSSAVPNVLTLRRVSALQGETFYATSLYVSAVDSASNISRDDFLVVREEDVQTPFSFESGAISAPGDLQK